MSTEYNGELEIASLSPERRAPGGELPELLVGAVIVAHALVERGDLRHLIFRQSKVEDIEIIPYVRDVFTAAFFFTAASMQIARIGSADGAASSPFLQ